jgi:beta-glucanase (GH16 family)
MAFVLVYENDFSAPLGAEWLRYNGVPACCPTSKWDAENAVVKNGRLVLRGLRQPDGSYHTAGVSLPHLNLTYGRVRFRGRFDKGLGLQMCALLWPQTGFQPPEIDFAESRTEDADRTTMCMTLHYPPTAGQAIRHEIRTDFSHWHTWGVTWMPGHLSCTVDGTTWAVIDEATLGKVVVPKTPMHFGIQTTMGSPGKAKPGATTPPEVSLHIDSVSIWRYGP